MPNIAPIPAENPENKPRPVELDGHAPLYQRLLASQAAGAAISSSLDLRQVLNTTVYEIANLFQVQSCSILEWNQQTQALSLLAKYSHEGWWQPSEKPLTYRLTDYPQSHTVLSQQSPQQTTINQPDLDEAERKLMQQAGAKSQLKIPLIFQKQVWGLILLEDKQHERVFTAADISLGGQLANQVVHGIKNARLFEQAQAEIVQGQRTQANLARENQTLVNQIREQTLELGHARGQLDQTGRLQDEFLSSMSHELRTPLNTILGAAEILQSEVFGTLTEKQRKYVNNSSESGQLLLALINDILALSKIEAGKVKLHLSPVSITSLCQNCVRQVSSLAQKKGIIMSQNVDQQTITAQADEGWLKQVLVNLLNNAVKFTPGGGEVALTVSGNAAEKTINFMVTDTGVGIAPENLERIFTPFIQVDSSLSRQYYGTGLGLSLVTRIIEMHGGAVSVESQVDKGSCFTVSIPWL